MHSLYEIETTVKRSAKSQGLSWGISEEIGKSIRILEQKQDCQKSFGREVT